MFSFLIITTILYEHPRFRELNPGIRTWSERSYIPTPYDIPIKYMYILCICNPHQTIPIPSKDKVDLSILSSIIPSSSRYDITGYSLVFMYMPLIQLYLVSIRYICMWLRLKLLKLADKCFCIFICKNDILLGTADAHTVTNSDQRNKTPVILRYSVLKYKKQHK